MMRFRPYGAQNDSFLSLPLHRLPHTLQQPLVIAFGQFIEQPQGSLHNPRMGRDLRAARKVSMAWTIDLTGFHGPFRREDSP